MDDKSTPLNADHKKTLPMDGIGTGLEVQKNNKTLEDIAKEELDAKLARGEINGIEYNKRLIELRLPQEHKIQDSSFSESTKTNSRIAGLILVVMLISSIVLIINYLSDSGIRSTISTDGIPDYSGSMKSTSLSGPIQINFDKEVSKTGEYKGRPIEITYKAYYDITGVVTSVHDYNGFGLYDSLVPRDVCIAWSNVAQKFKSGRLEFWQDDRYCASRAGSHDWSNNHLISSTDEIRDQISNLKAGDDVRLVGYLVRVLYDEKMILDSSMSRVDTGDHACETFYVTKIEKE